MRFSEGKVKDKKDPAAGQAEEKDKLASVKRTQSVSLLIPPNSVTTEPTQAKVSATGGKWTQKINNRGNKKLIYKIRCSNNNAYRVSPVFGFVDASGSANVEIIRLNGVPKEDKIVFQYTVAPADATDAQIAFAHVQPTGDLVVNVVAS
ncbi:MSP domain protein [Cooperia oncophora]